MAKTLTPEVIAKAQALFRVLAQAQATLWDTASELEDLLGLDIDTTSDWTYCENATAEAVQGFVDEWEEAHQS